MQKINLNNANLDELREIEGLGEKRAQDIVEYRSSHGEFHSLDDVLNIPGCSTDTIYVLRRGGAEVKRG